MPLCLGENPSPGPHMQSIAGSGRFADGEESTSPLFQLASHSGLFSLQASCHFCLLIIYKPVPVWDNGTVKLFVQSKKEIDFCYPSWPALGRWWTCRFQEIYCIVYDSKKKDFLASRILYFTVESLSRIFLRVKARLDVWAFSMVKHCCLWLEIAHLCGILCLVMS